MRCCPHYILWGLGLAWAGNETNVIFGAEKVKTDVVIVGAGAAGIRAATRLQEIAGDELDFVILETVDRVGGRVKSKTNFGKGKWTVEEGAIWYTDEDYNPIAKLAKNYKLKSNRQFYFDFEDSTYVYNDEKPEDNATNIDKKDVRNTVKQYQKGPHQCMLKKANRLWNEKDNDDTGILKTLEGCGWDESDPLQYALKWMYVDFEYAAKDSSLYAGFDVYSKPKKERDFQVNDKRGFEFLLEEYAKDTGVIKKIKFNHKVTKVEYDVHEDKYRARVTAKDGKGRKIKYLAQRVVMTVASGVIEEELIEFEPSLDYMPSKYNPMKMELLIKVFFQFKDAFWEENDFLYTLKEKKNDGRCVQWMNLDARFLKGSKVLVCYLTTQSMEALLGNKIKTDELSKQQISGLLEPLRRSYGDAYSEPKHVFVPTWNTDKSTGYGAYENWVAGYTPWDYYHFYGGGEDNYYIQGQCEHNGCNKNKEWILYLSGTASCLCCWSSVPGAWFSGATSMSYALQSLGFEMEEDWYDVCYESDF